MIRKDFHSPLCAALLALTLGGTAARAATPASGGSKIDSVVSVAYQATPGGITQIVSSNDAGVMISAPTLISAPTPGVSLTPEVGAQQIAPHTLAVIPVTLHNSGGTGTFAVTLTQAPGWFAGVVADTFGDGNFRPGRNVSLPARITLTAGSSLTFLLVMQPSAGSHPAPSATVG